MRRANKKNMKLVRENLSGEMREVWKESREDVEDCGEGFIKM